MSNIVQILVPAGVAGGIAADSAILGREAKKAGGGAVWDCWCEGNIYGVGGLERYASRLRQAADRMREDCPTVARAFLPLPALQPVGTYDLDRMYVVEIMDPATLEAWAGEGVEAIQGKRYETGRMTWGEAAAIVHAEDDLKKVLGMDPSAGLYAARLQAGQVVIFRGAEQDATIYEMCDPALPSLLENIVDDVGRRFVFGLDDETEEDMPKGTSGPL